MKNNKQKTNKMDDILLFTYITYPLLSLALIGIHFTYLGAEISYSYAILVTKIAIVVTSIIGALKEKREKENNQKEPLGFYFLLPPLLSAIVIIL
jgi:hypothetical protein